MSPRRRRVCSRVLLVDEMDRVLLFNGIDHTTPELLPWWFTIGGELEQGETAAEAAIRETHEETGLAISDAGAPVFDRRFTWDFEGQTFEQHERFFLVRCRNFEPTSDYWTETESGTIRGHGWWTIDELSATDETVFPEDLAAQLERLLNVRD